MTESTKSSLSKVVEKPWAISSWLWGSNEVVQNQKAKTIKDLAAKIAKSLHEDGRNDEDAAQVAWMMAVSGAGNPVTAVSELNKSPFSEDANIWIYSLQRCSNTF